MRNFRKIITLGLLSSIIICISVVVKADNTISSTSTSLSQSSSSHFSTSSSSTTNQSSTSNNTSSSNSPVLSSISSTVSQFIQSDNHPMGYAWKIQSNSTNSFNPLSFIKLSSTVNAPADLSSDNSNLPRKDAVDISSAQSWMTQTDFDNLKKQGVKTVVIKLTEGTGYTNPYAKSFLQMAKNSGLNIATYHYARLGDTSDQATANSQAVAEAEYFVSVARNLGIPSNTAMILDCESPAVNINSVDWTLASLSWEKEMVLLGYSNVKYYTSQSWTTAGGGNLMEEGQLGKTNMWLAQYLYGTPSSSNLQNTKFGAWQYSSQMYYVGASHYQPIDTSIDYANLFSQSAAPVNVPIYRLYNPTNYEHFYTASLNEATTLIQIGWGYSEGISYYAPASGGIPVYRLYNPYIQMHMYTTDSNEYNVLATRGWNQEGVAFYATSASSGQVPVYRLYNPQILQHLYTTDLNEYNVLATRGWNQEGIAWYGMLN
ncbi:GH25 family lysozyme [Lactovum miscens]|uniref:GH25 family lysozyme M1 (1,4-beta-N-acetylmuramidase) n=1 Tax=Lactovum miscens TaxID=190387 RepID=A0A841C7V9_9LACT|nr:GH25 family lysozyme [Lactovum miscens]MBB5887682.1 GH25 family lysozyme M1 (1,4-beta-N-acetylmuramidase) [Lactovum miscens]